MTRMPVATSMLSSGCEVTSIQQLFSFVILLYPVRLGRGRRRESSTLCSYLQFRLVGVYEGMGRLELCWRDLPCFLYVTVAGPIIPV